MADLKRPQRVAPRRSSSEDEDEEKEDLDNSAYEAPAKASRRGSGGSRTKSDSKQKAQKNRKAFYNADGTAIIVVPATVSRSSPAALPTDNSATAAVAIVQDDGVLTSSGLEQIPFASPVFVMDRDAHLEPSEFWRLWKQAETTYVQYNIICLGGPRGARYGLACVWSGLNLPASLIRYTRDL